MGEVFFFWFSNKVKKVLTYPEDEKIKQILSEYFKKFKYLQAFRGYKIRAFKEGEDLIGFLHEEDLREEEVWIKLLNSLGELVIRDWILRKLLELEERAYYLEDEGDYLKALCELFTKGGNVSFCRVSRVEGERVCPVFSCGKEGEYGLEGVLKAFKEKKIVIVEGESSCHIPITLEDRVEYVLSLYSQIPRFFREEFLTSLELLSLNLSRSVKGFRQTYWINLLKDLVESAGDWILITDLEGRIIYANRSVERMSGYKREEILGNKPNLFKSGYHSGEFYKRLWDTILSGKSFRAIFVNRRKDGSLFFLDELIFPIKRKGKIVGFSAIGKDITRERELLEKLRKVYYTDVRTGLLNRMGFEERLSQVLKYLKDKLVPIIYLDVSNFRGITGTYGREFGEKLILELSKRLRGFLKEGFLARVGEDDFLLAPTHLKDKGDIANFLRGLQKVLEEPFNLEGKSLKLNFGIGISLYPYDGKDVGELIQKAESALYRSKTELPSSPVFFKEEMNLSLISTYLLQTHLERALEKEEFILFYQPIYEIKDRKVVGFEAPLRWKSEDLGFVPPSKFIPLLEKSGLINEVGRWVLERVCKKLKELMEKDLFLAFNLSSLQIYDQRFIPHLRKLLEDLKLKPSLLVVELTESAYIGKLEVAKKFLNALKELGVKVSIDDFGTGYSSLSYLKEFPVDKLKIDVSFIRDIDKNLRSRSIVSSIIFLGKKLGFKTVAEGVEREETLRVLKYLGCDYAQGFLFSPPVPEENLKDFLT